GCARILAGERALSDLAGGEHRPDHVAFGGEADIDAILVNLAVVTLGRSVRLGENAADVLRGAEDETDAAGNVAVERADVDALGRVGLLGELRNGNDRGERRGGEDTL